MTEIWAQASLWLGLALLASLLSIWLRIATALSEIVVGTIAQLLIGAALGGALLSGDATWIKFLSGAGAILLTFLAGAELDPAVFRRQWKQATAIGLVSFAGPFFGCAAIARWGLGWSVEASWLAGIAMSTTSVAVVYAVMLEFGLNATNYGKVVLAACFIVALFWQRRKISMKNRLLLKSNDEQKALLQEVHHRVKNNLQYIVSLTNLQMHQSENSELHERLDEIKTRIMAMGIIHQRLYTSQGIFRVDVSGFAAELVDNLLNAMPSKVPVSRSLHLNPVEVNVDTAISIGLLLNELLTNAIKHAFVGHPSPALEVTISKDNECMLLRLRDNGPGYDFGAHSNG